MNKTKLNTNLTTLAIVICAFGFVAKLWDLAGFQLIPFDKGGGTPYYFSKSIVESKETNAYIGKYRTMYGDLSYSSTSCVPPIKEAFIEWQYYRHINPASDRDRGRYWYELDDNATRIIIVFNDSIYNVQSGKGWHIKHFRECYPLYINEFETTEIPDTLTLELYYYDRIHPDSIIEVPMGTIKLTRDLDSE